MVNVEITQQQKEALHSIALSFVHRTRDLYRLRAEIINHNGGVSKLPQTWEDMSQEFQALVTLVNNAFTATNAALAVMTLTSGDDNAADKQDGLNMELAQIDKTVLP